MTKHSKSQLFRLYCIYQSCIYKNVSKSTKEGQEIGVELDLFIINFSFLLKYTGDFRHASERANITLEKLT